MIKRFVTTSKRRKRTVLLHLPEELLQAVDAYAKQIAEGTFEEPNRSRTIRMLIELGLERLKDKASTSSWPV